MHLVVYAVVESTDLELGDDYEELWISLLSYFLVTNPHSFCIKISQGFQQEGQSHHNSEMAFGAFAFP